MQPIRSSVLLVVLLIAPSPAQATTITPIQKVIDMMNDMLAKGKKEKHEEMVAFTAFTQWCESTRAAKEKAIKEGTDAIAQLEADITKAEADAQKLGTEIEALDASIDKWSKEKAAATAIRKKERADYEVANGDYEENIEATNNAIKTLKSQDKDTAQASLLQLQRSKRVPDHAKQVLTAFLQSSSSEEAPEANAYEFQGGSVVEMFEKLVAKFVAEKQELDEREITLRANYELLKQTLNDDIEEATKSRTEKAEMKAKRLDDSADAQADLASTNTALIMDKRYLTDLNSEQTQKTNDFNSRQKLRAEEIVAIEKAIEIIASPEVSGAGEKHLPQMLVQTSLAQLRSATTSPVQEKVASFLMARANTVKSRLLAMMASHAAEDPFAKVKKMIKDLIVKLITEANEEADAKGWCDNELSTNKATRDEKSSEVERLTSEIEEAKALEAKLTDEMDTLTKQIKEINEAVAKATEERKAEKAKNTETIAEAKTASAAVTAALTVLKEFYAKAAAATALVQRSGGPAGDDAPATFNKPYKGMGGSSGGVLGMLEVIGSDFKRLQVDTEAAESEAEREFDTFTADSAEDKKAKEKEHRHKGFKLTRTVRAMNQAKKDLEVTQEELDAALEYFEKLKPSCVDTGLSYEDRVAKRKEEIVSLQEALKVLTGEDLA